MSQLSLLLALAGLAASPAPQDPQPAPPKQAQDEGYGGLVGTLDRRWQSRSESRKVLAEYGGKSLVDAWQGTWLWLNTQIPAEDALMPAEDDRAVGVTSLCALSMSGNGSGIRSGAQFREYRILTRAMRALQDKETGAYVKADAPEAALDQALAVHCMAEATITNPVEALFTHNQKGVDALLALRGEDGLWHAGGKKDGAVDAVATGVAAYALSTAKDAGAEIDPDVFSAIADWSAKSEPAGADEPVRATETVAMLLARIFAFEGLGQGLKGDERVQELLTAVGAWLPEPSSEGEPGSDGMARNNDFAYLASVALYQADNRRWDRLYSWIADQAIEDTDSRTEDVGALAGANDGLPAGENGRMPKGMHATTALRLLQMVSSFREPSLGVFAN